MTLTVRATVREVHHRVRLALPPETPKITDCTGRKRKAYGLRLDYGVGISVARVDIVVEFRHSAEHWPPSAEMPPWLNDLIDTHRPADVTHPAADRRTGMGGWPIEKAARAEEAALWEAANRRRSARAKQTEQTDDTRADNVA